MNERVSERPTCQPKELVFVFRLSITLVHKETDDENKELTVAKIKIQTKPKVK